MRLYMREYRRKQKETKKIIKPEKKHKLREFLGL